MADSRIFYTNPDGSTERISSTAPLPVAETTNPLPVAETTNPLPVAETLALGVNTTLSALAPAAAAVTTISLDLGATAAQYQTAVVLLSALADAGNVLALEGSADNVTFFPLVAADVSGLAFVRLTASVVGFRYLQGIFTNGATAQTAASLVLGGQ